MVQTKFLCAALASLLLLTVTAQPLEVVKLTPSNFEKETQAATGQTTGHWCVLFTNSSDSSSLQIAAEDAWEHLAEDEDKSTIMAKVDLSSGGSALLKRFNISSTPSAILFRDRSMYTLELSGGADADKVSAAVHAFMDGGYEHQVPHPVPKESGWVDMVLDAAKSLQVSPTPLLWAGIAGVVLGAALFLGFCVFGLYYMYAPDKPATPAKQAAAAKAAAAMAKKDQAAAAAAATPAAAANDDEDVGESSAVKPNTRASRRRA